MRSEQPQRWGKKFALCHFRAGNLPADAFTVGNSFENVIVFGQTGSGKSSGPGQSLMTAMMAEYGGLFLTAKVTDTEEILAAARRAGREQDIVLLGPDHSARFNALDYLYRSGGKTRSADTVVATILSLLEVKDRGRGYGSDPFWLDSAKQLLGSAIDLLGAAGETITFPAIAKLMDSAARSDEEVRSLEWRERSYLNLLLEKALARRDLSAYQANDLAVAVEFWLVRFPHLDPKTSGGITATVSSLTYPFEKNFMAELFGTTTTITPEETFQGKILIIDLPVKKYLEAGQFGQVLVKTIWQKAVERRNASPPCRPLVLWADEAHLFTTSYDPLFLSTCRSARTACIYLCQSVDSIRSRLPGVAGESEAEALFGNFNLKIYCANDHIKTNEMASKQIGEEWQTRSNINTTFGDKGSVGAGTSDSRRFRFEPHRFTSLRRGGSEGAGVVEAVVFRSGRPFSTGFNHLLVGFPQNL